MDNEQMIHSFVRDLADAESIYQRLIELTRKQSEVLESGDTERLMDFARQKESELGRLAPVEVRLRSARESWGDVESGVSAEQRRSVQEGVRGVETVLRQLLELEEEQNRAILKRREGTLEEIRRIEAGRRVQKAYGAASAHGSSGVFDQKE
jgi:hypothetical protein